MHACNNPSSWCSDTCTDQNLKTSSLVCSLYSIEAVLPESVFVGSCNRNAVAGLDKEQIFVSFKWSNWLTAVLNAQIKVVNRPDKRSIAQELNYGWKSEEAIQEFNKLDFFASAWCMVPYLFCQLKASQCSILTSDAEILIKHSFSCSTRKDLSWTGESTLLRIVFVV